MLVVWTQDKAELLKRVIAPQIAESQAPHKVVAIEEATLPEAGEGDVVLCMGTKALEVLLHFGLVPKNRTISSLRFPNVIKFPSGAVGLMTYPAAMIDLDYEKYVSTILSLSLAIRYAKTGSFKPKLGVYRYVNDFSDAIAYIKQRYAETGKPVELAVDTETLSLNPRNPKAWIISIQLTYRAGAADVAYFPTPASEQKALSASSQVREQLEWLLNTEMVSTRGANLKYDLSWLWCRAGLECSNFKLDTMIVGSLLDENRGNSLNLHAKWYCPDLGGYDDDFNKKHDKGRMDLVPPSELLNYAGGDTDACYRVAAKMKDELLRDERLARFYVKILHPATRAYEHVERTGFLVDVPAYLELEDEIETEIARLEKEALALIGGKICVKYSDNLKLSRPALLTEFMFSPMGLNLTPKMFTAGGKDGKGPKLPSTSIDHFLMFDKEPKAKAFVAILKEWASATKTLSTYVCKRDSEGRVIGGFLSHLQADSRFHATYYLFNGSDTDGGTNTGRLSARDPAIQTIPKHTIWAKRLRKCFIAPPGFLILSNDYSQGELKIAACLANEQRMIEAYSKGIDLHAVTASRLAGYEWNAFVELQKSNPDLYDSIRQLGKAGNFGLIYGMGAEGFMNYAALNYRVNISLSEAQASRDKFFDTYPALPKWHMTYKNHAHNWGMVRSPLGRVRHLPLIKSKNSEMRSKAERQSVNAPVQSTLSDMSLWATAIFHQKGWHHESPAIAMVHDQLLSYVPEDKWEDCAKRNKHVMENLPFHEIGWQPQLKFTVDAEVGPNLGELKKKKIEA